MNPKISQVLNADTLKQLLEQNIRVDEIVSNLFSEGKKLSEIVEKRHYGHMDEFKKAHLKGETELAELEGESDIGRDNIIILKGCPMSEELQKLKVNGELPEHYNNIVNEYMEQNPGSNAILHPGCIAHQVARQMIIKHIDIKNEKDLNFYQIACRNTKTGKVVYDDNGLDKSGLSKGEVDKLIADGACLYVITKN